MNYTFGKIGLGLAGAVAAVGLMSACVQTANAELELIPSPGLAAPDANPEVASQAGYYTYTYAIGLTDSSNNGPPSTITPIDFTISANGTVGQLNYSGPGNTGSILNSYFQIQDFNGYNSVDTATYTNTPGTAWGNILGAAGTIQTSTVGDWLLQQSGSTLTMYYTGTNISVTPGQTNDLGFFAFASTIGPGSTPDFQNYQSAVNTSTGGTIGGPTEVEVPSLPLPAAFWPGLMTLGGMAVVGGLRLRRRAL